MNNNAYAAFIQQLFRMLFDQTGNVRQDVAANEKLIPLTEAVKHQRETPCRCCDECRLVAATTVISTLRSENWPPDDLRALGHFAGQS